MYSNTNASPSSCVEEAPHILGDAELWPHSYVYPDGNPFIKNNLSISAVRVFTENNNDIMSSICTHMIVMLNIVEKVGKIFPYYLVVPWKNRLKLVITCSLQLVTYI